MAAGWKTLGPAGALLFLGAMACGTNTGSDGDGASTTSSSGTGTSTEASTEASTTESSSEESESTASSSGEDLLDIGQDTSGEPSTTGDEDGEGWCQGWCECVELTGIESCLVVLPEDLVFLMDIYVGDALIPVLRSYTSCAEAELQDASGWLYIDGPADPGQVELCGSACEDLLAAGQLNVVYNCPLAPP